LAQPFGQGGDGVFCSTVHGVRIDGRYVASKARSRKWSCNLIYTF
jgi:hypothetical protein